MLFSVHEVKGVWEIDESKRFSIWAWDKGGHWKAYCVGEAIYEDSTTGLGDTLEDAVWEAVDMYNHLGGLGGEDIDYVITCV